MRRVAPFLAVVVSVSASIVLSAQEQPAAAAQGARGTAVGITQPSGIVISGAVRRTTGEPIKKAVVTLQPTGAQANQGSRGGRGGGNQGPQNGPPQRGNQPQLNGAPAVASRSVATNGDGSFTFGDVLPGTYRLRAEHEGYVAMEYGQRALSGQGITLTLQAGQKLSVVDFRLTQTAAISGRIVDEDGQPAAGIQVQAVSYQYRQGQRSLVAGNQAQTNDLGEYRLFWLQPGEYYVNAILNNPGGRGGGGRGGGPNAPSAAVLPDMDESYAPYSYYPDGMEPSRAITIDAVAGADIRGINFNIRPQKTGKVAGTVLPAVEAPPPSVQQQAGARGGPPRSGQTLAAVEVALLQYGAGNGVRGAVLGRGSVRTDGTFEIPRVVPGTYNVAAFVEQNNTDYTAMASVTVSAGSVSSVTLPFKPSVDVNGQVFIEGLATANGTPQQFAMTGVQIRLVPADDFPGAGQEGSSAKENGTFSVANVRALRYRVEVQVPPGAYLTAGTYGSADALNGPIDLVDSATPLQFRLGIVPGKIEGTVVDRAGQPYPGATVTLAPSVRTRLDLYKNVTSDLNGRFLFQNQAPGDYKIFAWEQILQGAWQDPIYLEKFEDRGRVIHLDRSAAVSEEIVVIPAASN